MLKYKGKLSYTDDLYTTKNWKPLFFELFIYFWHPFPFLYDVSFDEWDDNYKYHIKHSANDILLAFMIIVRVYLLIRFLVNNNYFMSS